MGEYGVPARIRTDNGVPFAGTGPLGPSKLSLGWMKFGIVHERIQAGRPQQNGRHERMHRTLKDDTTVPLRTVNERFMALNTGLTLLSVDRDMDHLLSSSGRARP